MRTYANRGKGEFISMRKFTYNFFLIEHLVHKLLAINARLYVRKQKQAA